VAVVPRGMVAVRVSVAIGAGGDTVVISLTVSMPATVTVSAVG